MPQVPHPGTGPLPAIEAARLASMAGLDLAELMAPPPPDEPVAEDPPAEPGT